MIGIIDYKLNNLRSVQKAFEKVGASSFISSDVKELSRADKLVLPGVGAFGKAMENIKSLGLDELICTSANAGEAVDRNMPGNAAAFHTEFRKRNA